MHTYNFLTGECGMDTMDNLNWIRYRTWTASVFLYTIMYPLYTASHDFCTYRRWLFKKSDISESVSYKLNRYALLHIVWGRDIVVVIATHYGLHGPEMESWWGRDFPHPSRPAPWPTQSPIPGVGNLLVMLCRNKVTQHANPPKPTIFLYTTTIETP